MPFAEPGRLERLMDVAWPALERGRVDAWDVRFSAGVTRRANSVLPLGDPADPAAAVAEVERRSAARWLEPAFQVSPAASAGLDALLEGRGYRIESPTIVQTAEGADLHRFAGGADPRVSLAGAPDDEWLDVYWAQEGPVDADDRAVCRSILLGCESVYASLRVDGRTVATARLALAHGYGGLYCVATRPDARRRGYGSAVVRALLAEADARRLEGVWLQVREANTQTILLYHSLGFSTTSSYHYRVGAA